MCFFPSLWHMVTSEHLCLGHEQQSVIVFWKILTMFGCDSWCWYFFIYLICRGGGRGVTWENCYLLLLKIMALIEMVSLLSRLEFLVYSCSIFSVLLAYSWGLNILIAWNILNTYCPPPFLRKARGYSMRLSVVPITPPPRTVGVLCA